MMVNQHLRWRDFHPINISISVDMALLLRANTPQEENKEIPSSVCISVNIYKTADKNE